MLSPLSLAAAGESFRVTFQLRLNATINDAVLVITVHQLSILVYIPPTSTHTRISPGLGKRTYFTGELRCMQCHDGNYMTWDTPKISCRICFFQAQHITFHRSDPVILGRSMHKCSPLTHPPHPLQFPTFFVCVIVLSHHFPFFCPLLFQAIIESPNKQLTLSDIYAWFQSTFGHFRQHNATWKVTRNTKPNNNSLTKTRNLCLIITQ